jgi:hypothetical protein
VTGPGPPSSAARGRCRLQRGWSGRPTGARGLGDLVGFCRSPGGRAGAVAPAREGWLSSQSPRGSPAVYASRTTSFLPCLHRRRHRPFGNSVPTGSSAAQPDHQPGQMHASAFRRQQPVEPPRGGQGRGQCDVERASTAITVRTTTIPRASSGAIGHGQDGPEREEAEPAPRGARGRHPPGEDVARGAAPVVVRHGSRRSLRGSAWSSSP